jgi:hypothetical protein
VNVKEAGRREGEVANWGDRVSGNFGTLAGLASSGPSAAGFLNGWPHEALGDELSRCLNTWVAEGVLRVENLTAVRRRDVWAWFSRRGAAVQID